MLLQSNALKAALQPYTVEGPFGDLLDAADETLAPAAVQCFEMEALMAQHDSGRARALPTCFTGSRRRSMGAPTLLILDEAWIFLDHPLFAARIREWLKVLRKKNVAVVFATQSSRTLPTA